MSENILAIENVAARYGDFLAVQDASLCVPNKSIVSIIGSNGAGKSTLMDCVAGVHKPSSGRIFFKGDDITGLPAYEIVRRGLSLVPQGSRCFVRMTVEDNLIMGSFPGCARKGATSMLEKVYELFPVLKEKRNDLSGSLSGGQRQMVAIGRSLMSQPDLILFDEISLGLAPTIIKDIYSRIRQINAEGTSIVLVEQDVKRSVKTSDYSHVMLKGKIVLSGPSRELTEEDIKNAYFGI
ncbi:MAG: ABC transporter ATP-binding protein [Saccharofermentanales bacterium]|jgi:branched-chain amino acid transport system ATP-binding protein